MQNCMPELRLLNGRKMLYVDGKPFIILGLQWDCDSCYSAETLISMMPVARKLGCNTAVLPLMWRLIEPEEGVYDFSILEAMLRGARENDLRVVPVWFGSYKNACLNYAPDWVRENEQRFRRAVKQDGTSLHNFACYSCEETLRCDVRVVEKIFEYLRDHDPDHRVILFQVNNETGLLNTTRCHCPECNRRFAEADHMGLSGVRADELFSAERILSFMETIAQAAKAIYPLPCYMNAWLPGHSPDCLPGDYPSGGPVERVLGYYRQHKRFIDFVSPDVYDTGLNNFLRRCEEYSFEGNSLYIAEHGAGVGSRAEQNVYYALGRYGAIGFDPWAIDCAFPGVEGRPLYCRVTGRISDEAYELAQSYLPIRDAMQVIAHCQNTDRMAYWVQEPGDVDSVMDLEGVRILVQYVAPQKNSRGLAMKLDEYTYVIVGCGGSVRLFDKEGVPLTIERIDYGQFKDETFLSERRTRREREDKTAPFRMQDAGVYLVQLQKNT